MLDTTAANLVLRCMKKKLVNPLAVINKKKLRDELAAVADPTSLTNIYDVRSLTDISSLIEDLQTEMRFEIPREQVSSLEVTVQ